MQSDLLASSRNGAWMDGPCRQLLTYSDHHIQMQQFDAIIKALAVVLQQVCMRHSDGSGCSQCHGFRAAQLQASGLLGCNHVPALLLGVVSLQHRQPRHSSRVHQIHHKLETCRIATSHPAVQASCPQAAQANQQPSQQQGLVQLSSGQPCLLHWLQCSRSHRSRSAQQ